MKGIKHSKNFGAYYYDPDKNQTMLIADEVNIEILREKLEKEIDLQGLPKKEGACLINIRDKYNDVVVEYRYVNGELVRKKQIWV